MWSPTPDGDQGAAFLLQVWSELFSSNTPETFRVRYTHPNLLVEELAQLARLAQQDQRWEKHLKPVKDELRSLCVEHNLLFEGHEREMAMMDSLIRETSLTRTVAMADAWRRHGFSVASVARRALRMLKPGEKKRAAQLLGLLATDAIAGGVPLEQLRAAPDDAQAEGSMDAALDAIERSMSLNPGSYTCMLFAEGKKADIQAVLEMADGRFARSHELETVSKRLTEIHTDVVSSHKIVVTAQAESPIHAAREAVERLSRAFDILVFYRMGSEVSLRKMALVECEGRWRWMHIEGPALDVLRNRNRARHLTQKVISEVGLDGLDTRIVNALELFSLAQKAGDHRSRLIGIWSALESLTGPSKGEDVLTRIGQVVVPAMVLRRSDRVTRYLAISLCESQAHERLAPEHRALFPGLRRHFFPSDGVLVGLCGKEKNPHVMALLQVSGRHPLLRWRLFRAWEVFHEPTKLAKRLEATGQNVTWQLKRIYRARNLIVHHGEGYQNLDLLLRHAEYYLTTALTKILHDVVHGPKSSLEEVLAGVSVQHDVLLHLLRRHPELLRLRDLSPSRREGFDLPLFS